MNKKTLSVIILGLFAVICLAQDFKPYGSARIGYWYENQSKEMTGNKSDLDLNYALQSNSRFGANFTKDNLIAKVEYGTAVNLRLLYAKLKFNNYSILVGQDYDGTNEYASQVYGDDCNLIGYGAVDGGRNPQVKIEFDKGLYLALIKPAFTASSGFTSTNTDILFPRINLGYRFNMDNITIHPTLVLQQIEYTKDDNTTLLDDVSYLSYLMALNAQYKMEATTVKAQFNYGVNTGNMNYKGPKNSAVWNTTDNELSDTATMGGFMEVSNNLNDNLSLNLGAGYASSSNDEWDEADAQSSVYLQTKIKLSKLQIVPEIGIQDKMKDKSNTKEGNKIYFGTQLRMDF